MRNRLAIVLLVSGCTGPGSEDEPVATDVVLMARLTDEAGSETDVRYSPDGRRIAFTFERAGRADIHVVSLETGESRPLTSSEGRDTRPAWSPDGERIAFQSDRGDGKAGVWVMSKDGGEPHRLTDSASYAGAPDWSPDGATIVYQGDASGSMDIWAIPAEGGPPKRVTDHPDNEWHPRWSPDGRHVVFYSTWGDAMTDIWITEIESGELEQVTTSPAEDYRPVFSPNGEWIAFISNRDEDSALWAVARRDGRLVKLTEDGTHRDYLDWSPDGSSLAFSRLDNAALFTIPVRGGTPERVTGTDADRSEPQLSPDGNHVAFVSRFEREKNIWIARADGSEARVLAGINEFQESPTWSPDGRSVAFVQGVGGDPRSADLWVAPAAGGSARQVTRLGFVERPVWCEDNQTLVVSSHEGDVEPSQLFRVALESGDASRLTTLAASAHPSDCSRERDTVLFTTEGDARSRLFTTSLEGGEPVVLDLEVDGGIDGARWSPDGRWIAFLSGGAVHVVPSAGGAPRRVEGADAVESVPSWSPDGATLLFSRRAGRYDVWSLDIASALSEPRARR